MNPPPESSRIDSAGQNAYQDHIHFLQDRLLLSVRDGTWHKVSDLASWLAPRVIVNLAIERYLEAGGVHEKQLGHKSAEGQALILKDILDALRRGKLIESRKSEDGNEVRVTPRVDKRFEIDAEFENILPRAPDEVKKLEERLLVEEPRDPLVVWKGHGTLVDGHTRYRIFSLLGRDYPVVEMAFENRGAVIAWLYDTHYGRRSYSPEMKSYVRGKQYLVRKQGHGGARKKASAQSGYLKTADAVAAEYGVGRNTVRRDAAFAEALDGVADICGDEVRQQVLSRVARWSRRDVERLATLEKSTLQEIVSTALESRKRPRIPSPIKSKTSAPVNIPKGKPIEQVRALRKVLGMKGLTRLQKALSQFLEQQKHRRSAARN